MESSFTSDQLNQLLVLEILGNTILNYFKVAGLFVFYLLAFKLLQVVLLSRLARLSAKTTTDLDDTLVKIIQSLRPPFYYFVAFYLAIQSIELIPIVAKFTTIILITWSVFQGIFALQLLVEYFARKKMSQEGEDDSNAEMAIQAISMGSKITLWTIGSLFILSNIGVDVTSLIAGLGIGGIAVAFAVKDVLGDLFSSFSIYMDKPFKVGDTIKVNNYIGTVTKVGIKTTRIKSLRGEEVVIPNQTLTTSDLQNYQTLERRRVEIHLGIAYQTPYKKITKLPQQIQHIIEAQDNLTFSRVHLKELGQSALIYEIIYYVEVSSYETYMDTKQDVLLEILKLLDKEKVEIAYPTQTVQIQKI